MNCHNFIVNDLMKPFSLIHPWIYSDNGRHKIFQYFISVIKLTLFWPHRYSKYLDLLHFTLFRLKNHEFRFSHQFVLFTPICISSKYLISHFYIHFTLFSTLILKFPLFRLHFTLFRPIEAQNIWFPILIFILLFLAP